jgi:protein arginine N-methyltransferase 1
MRTGYEGLGPHKMMISDIARITSYRKAIFEIVKKGNVVVDIGTGTGILALFACQAGASKVYAIETSDIIEVAKQARVNGLEKRITFIKSFSEMAELPEKVDVIISEIIGTFAIEENILQVISDARKRFLKESGTIIPSSIKMTIVPIESSSLYKEIEFWSKDIYGVDFSSIHKMAANNRYIKSLNQGYFLSKPLPINNIDFYTVESKDLYINNTISFTIKRAGILHGLGGWFEAKLSKNITLSTSPPNPTTSWKNVFFPIEKTVDVESGDSVVVRMAVSSIGIDFVWNWNVDVLDKEGNKKAQFSHSTLQGSPHPDEGFPTELISYLSEESQP